MTTTSTNGKSKNKINYAQEVNFRTSPSCFSKIWPNYGQNWDIKEKKILHFAHFELLAKSLWCPEQDLNLHSSRNTHLKRTRLPIPPSGLLWCLVPRTRLELARLNRHYPLKVACLPIPPPGHFAVESSSLFC